MADYTPPIENLPIFDKLVFVSGTTYISQNDADKRYLRFPNAQGTENLASIVVNGTATFSSTTAPTSNQSVLPTTDDSNKIPTTAWTKDLLGALPDITVNGTASFTSIASAPTSLAVIPTSDNSTKIPTTAWVKSVAGGGGSVYSEIFTTNRFVILPTNCRCIDLVVMGQGGASGTNNGTSYGGSGSGGNMVSGYGLPIADGEILTLTFTTASSSVSWNSITIAQAFSGLTGGNFSSGSNVAGALSNPAIGTVDTTLGSFYTVFGNPGASSSSAGTVPPAMTGTSGCPKGKTVWNNGGFGMAKQQTSSSIGPGYVLITYHLGV